jgi:glucan phosphoethanolaminetransferase (alkaline phosphatase superfamily)
LLGIAGAVAACVALALHRRSHRAAAAVVIVVAAVPFAVATASNVVMPLTAVLMLAVGLPSVLGHSHSIPSAGGTS